MSFRVDCKGKAAFEFLNVPQFIFKLLGKYVKLSHLDFHLIAMRAASSISIDLFIEAILFLLLVLIILRRCVLLQQFHDIDQAS